MLSLRNIKMHFSNPYLSAKRASGRVFAAALAGLVVCWLVLFEFSLTVQAVDLPLSFQVVPAAAEPGGSKPKNRDPGPGTLHPASSTPAAGYYPLDVSGHWSQVELEALSTRVDLGCAAPGLFHPDEPVTSAVLLDWLGQLLMSREDALLILQRESTPVEPELALTRQELMVMAGRVLRALELLPALEGHEAHAILGSYPDADLIEPWARADVELALRAGLIRGRPGPQLAPQEVATRAEGAAVLSRLAVLYLELE